MTTQEDVYEALATGIDRSGGDAQVFLAKVCLLLSDALGDAERSLALIADAQRNDLRMRRTGDVIET